MFEHPRQIVKVVAAYAHWQLGKTERHGEILQEMLRKYDSEHPITNSDEFTTALTLCCNAKNALARQRGYTPEILVLGKSRILPGTNSQDQIDASQVLAECPSPEGIASETNWPKEKRPEKRSSWRTITIEFKGLSSESQDRIVEPIRTETLSCCGNPLLVNR